MTTTSDGGAVVDPVVLGDLTFACVDEVMNAMQSGSRAPDAVACDTFWHNILGVDAQRKPVTPVFTWADTRSGGVVPELARRLTQRGLEPAEVHARTGAELHSSYWPAKLIWLYRTQPETVNRVSWWMSFGEYLYLELFGERRVSVSMASGTGLFDQSECSWDREMLEALPIREQQLSPVREFSDGMSGLHPAFDARWPALKEVPWYLAVGDGACNNLGSGGFSERWAVLMIGTSGALRVVREGKCRRHGESADRVQTPPGLWTYRVDRRRLVQGGALSDGGNVFDWLERTLRLDPVAQLEDDLTVMAPDAHGLTVLPFLAGERSPNWNPDARAAIVGMTLNTRPLDIARASLEAVAYQFAAVYELMKRSIGAPGGIIGSGAGLIRSPIWLQIMSDVLGEHITVSAVPEGTSRGAALLALEAMGAFPDLAAVPAPLGTRYEPDQKHTTVYRAAMERQEELYNALIGEHRLVT